MECPISLANGTISSFNLDKHFTLCTCTIDIVIPSSAYFGIPPPIYLTSKPAFKIRILKSNHFKAIFKGHFREPGSLNVKGWQNKSLLSWLPRHMVGMQKTAFSALGYFEG